MLYLLPKIHKVGNPGRPIFSACGGLTEKISEFVDSKVRPFVTRLPSYVKDTTDFLNTIQAIHVPSNHTLMTIDVLLLYTNIPHNEGLDTCREHLLQPILNLNYFEFNGVIFHQVSGTAMGTKMAPNYANIFMGQLEKKLIDRYPTKPTLWLRYIDDVFCVFPGDPTEARAFLHYLNQQHATIKFTADVSTSTVNFLDVQVSRNQDGTLSTNLSIV